MPPLLGFVREGARVSEVMRARPHKYAAWPKIAHGIMRAPSALSEATRELIAAYVSGLNACHYCAGAHFGAAKALGVDPDLLAALLADPETAPVEPRLRPVLAYVRKLTLTPSRMVRADVEAVLAAGWDEEALHDAIAVCCMFNFMNRMVEGHGIDLSDEELDTVGQDLARGYPGAPPD